MANWIEMTEVESTNGTFEAAADSLASIQDNPSGRITALNHRIQSPI